MSEILLPSNAKYLTFIDTKLNFNPHFDVIWSFEIALSGIQHGFSTFIADNSSFIPLSGHYFGLPIDNLLSVVFDTNGYAALSTPIRDGILLSGIKPNSITIRDDGNHLIYHEALSSLDTSFVLTSSQKYWQTLRFRLSNLGTSLYIDLKKNNIYSNLLTLPININVTDSPYLYPGFTFVSPISSNIISPSTLFLKNFHVQGNVSDPTYENIPYTEFSIDQPSEYNQLINNFIIVPE